MAYFDEDYKASELLDRYTSEAETAQMICMMSGIDAFEYYKSADIKYWDEQLAELTEELNTLKSSLNALNSEIRELNSNCAEQSSIITEKYKDKIELIKSRIDVDERERKMKLNQQRRNKEADVERVRNGAQFIDENPNFSEYEKQALKFYLRKIEVIKNETTIYESMNASTSEAKMMHDIEIEGLEAELEKINKKYEEQLIQLRNAVDIAEGEFKFSLTEKSKQLQKLTEDMEHAVNGVLIQIDISNKTFKEEEEKLTEQINMLGNSPASNGLRRELNSLRFEHNKEIEKLNLQKSTTQNKYNGIINGVKIDINRINNELQQKSKPARERLLKAEKAKEAEVNVIQDKMDAANEQYKNEILESENQQSSLYKSNNDSLQQIEVDIKRYVTQQKNLILNRLQQYLSPVITESKKVDAYEYALHLFEISDQSYVRDELLELNSENPSELVGKELGAIKSLKAKPNIMIYNQVAEFSIIGVGTLFLTLFLLLVLHSIILAVLPIIPAVTIILFIEKERERQIAKYKRAATFLGHYKEITNLIAYYNSLIISEEYERLLQIGQQLYENQQSDRNLYEQKLGLMISNVESKHDRILEAIDQEYDLRKTKNNEQIKSIEDTRDSEISVIEKARDEQVADLKQQISSLKHSMQEIDDKVQLNAFYSLHCTLVKTFKSPIEYFSKSHGEENYILNNNLYVVNSKKTPVHIIHNKKPLVLTYSIPTNEKASEQEILTNCISNCISNIMMSFRLLNNTDVMEQFVIDVVSGGSKLNSTALKNMVGLKQNMWSLDEFKDRLKLISQKRNSLMDKTIDIENAQRQKKGDAPVKYTIAYFVYGPDIADKSRGLADSVARLITDCDKYGFLPIFVFEENAWNNRNTKEDSFASNVAKFIKNDIIVYKDNTYSTAKIL